MPDINLLYLERLKALTLTMAGMESISPGECRDISFLIFEKTKMMVGEDTLKRFFGFTVTKFGPSLATLNALSVYCGFKNWEAFPKLHPAELLKANDLNHYIANDPLIIALMDNATPTAVLKTNAPDFNILTYNKAFETATYTQKRSVKGITWWDAFDPEKAGGGGPTQLLEAFREVMFTKKTVKMEPLQYNILSAMPDITITCWWDIKIVPVQYNGVIKYLLLNINNITDKVVHQDAIEQAIMKELTMAEDLAVTNVKLSTVIKNLAESHEELMKTKTQLQEVNVHLEKRVFERTKKLFESEANQRELIDNAPVAIGVLKGPEHIVETANKKLIDYWGKDHAVINKPLAKAIPELEGQPFIGILDGVRETGVPYVNPELCALLNINGVIQSRYFDMVYYPMQYAPGITDHIFIVAVDITEHITALKKLQQSESMLRLAVTAANIGIWVLGPEKQLSYNPIFARILGWDSDESMTYDQALTQITTEYREKLSQAVELAISTNGEYDFTYSQKRFSDGKVIWLQGKGKVTTDDSGQHKIFSGIIREIDLVSQGILPG